MRDLRRSLEPHITSLTSIRLIAALAVFFSHYPIGIPDSFFYNVQKQGYAGVTIFFVLSGFILCINYFENFTSHWVASLPRFFVARFARIYPLYCLSILSVWITLPPGQELLPYLLGVQAWFEDFHRAFGINGPAWSVSIEIFMYLTFPLWILAVVRLGIQSSPTKNFYAVVTVVAAMFTLALYFVVSGKSQLSGLDINSAHRWIYRNPVTRLMDFVLGILIGIWYLKHNKESQAKKVFWSFAPYMSVIAMIILLISPWHLRSVFSWDFSFAITGALLIIGLAIHQRSMLAKLMNNRLLVVLGEASYAFYLFHVPLTSWYVKATGAMAKTPLDYLALLSFVIGATFFLHKVIEVPARKMIMNVYYCFARSNRPLIVNCRK